jgi:hypothetical protein
MVPPVLATLRAGRLVYALEGPDTSSWLAPEPGGYDGGCLEP